MEFFDENNNKIDINNIESDEQEQVRNYMPSGAVVLELGARYGTVSCIISKKLSNSLNLVAVEPDDTVWNALESNMKRNNCNFNIVKGIISNKKQSINYKEYSTTTSANNSSTLPNFTLDEIQQKYNLKFDTLVADCEGCLQELFEENPILYDQLKLIIIEHDMGKTNYELLTQNFKKNNFIEIENKFKDVTRSVWKKGQSGGKKKRKTRKQKKRNLRRKKSKKNL